MLLGEFSLSGLYSLVLLMVLPSPISAENCLQEECVQKICMHTGLDRRQTFSFKPNLCRNFPTRILCAENLYVRMQYFFKNNVFRNLSARMRVSLIIMCTANFLWELNRSVKEKISVFSCQNFLPEVNSSIIFCELGSQVREIYAPLV